MFRSKPIQKWICQSIVMASAVTALTHQAFAHSLEESRATATAEEFNAGSGVKLTPSQINITNYVAISNRVSAQMKKILERFENAKNANEFDEVFHDSQAQIDKLSRGNMLEQNALCGVIGSMENLSLQVVAPLIERNMQEGGFAKCQSKMKARLDLMDSSRKVSFNLDDDISNIKPMRFEERVIDPDRGYYSNQGFGEKEVMLTFDDGPTQKATINILKALKQAGIKAAFFSTGRQAVQNGDISKRILSEGHILASHSFYHTLAMGTKVNRGAISYDFFLSEMVGGHLAVFGSAGYIDPYFRFPNGCMNQTMKKNMKELGITIFGWSVDSFDWSFTVKRNPDADLRRQLVLKSFISELGKGGNKGVILMHDIFQQSAESLPLILNYLYENNYKIVLMTPPNRNIYNSTNLPLVTQALSFMDEKGLKLKDVRPKPNADGEPTPTPNYHPQFSYQEMFPQLSPMPQNKIDPNNKECYYSWD